jgi:hypothetical protein
LLIGVVPNPDSDHSLLAKPYSPEDLGDRMTFEAISPAAFVDGARIWHHTIHLHSELLLDFVGGRWSINV